MQNQNISIKQFKEDQRNKQALNKKLFLADYYLQQKQTSKALTIYQKYLILALRLGLNANYEILRVFQITCNIYILNNQFDQAIKRACFVLLKNQNKYGQFHIFCHSSYKLLASVLKLKSPVKIVSVVKQIINIYLKMLKIQESYYGQDKIQSIQTINNLAYFYLRLKQEDNALYYNYKILNIIGTNYQQDDLRSIYPILRIKQIYQNQKQKFSEQIKHCLKLLQKIYKKLKDKIQQSFSKSINRKYLIKQLGQNMPFQQIQKMSFIRTQLNKLDKQINDYDSLQKQIQKIYNIEFKNDQKVPFNMIRNMIWQRQEDELQKLRYFRVYQLYRYFQNFYVCQNFKLIKKLEFLKKSLFNLLQNKKMDINDINIFFKECQLEQIEQQVTNALAELIHNQINKYINQKQLKIAKQILSKFLFFLSKSSQNLKSKFQKSCLINLGTINRDSFDLKQALKYYHKAQKKQNSNFSSENQQFLKEIIHQYKMQIHNEKDYFNQKNQKNYQSLSKVIKNGLNK